MKRFPILGVLLLIPALLMFSMVGCNPGTGGKTTTTGAKSPTTTGIEGDKGKDGKTTTSGKGELDGAPEATVTGIVKIKGKAPEMAVIVKKDHGDAKTCEMGDVKDQTWVVNPDGRVANVIIVLGPAEKGMKFKLDAAVKKASTKTVHLDQPFCQYVPHVVGVYPAVQGLVSKNSATVNHNVKIDGAGDAGDVNPTLTPGKSTEVLKLTGLSGGENLLNAGCSIHGWMNAKIAVFNHPYFAVTNDKGEFKIENVPVGNKLTVYMWHESMGNLKDKVEITTKSFVKGDNSLDELELTGK